MRKNKYLIALFIVFCALLSCLALTACIENNDVNNDANKNSSQIVLNQHNIVLEKLESFLLIASSEEDLEGITWSSTDTSVASVVDGEIKAISAGTAIIKCKLAGSEDKCLVTVKDNKLTLSLKTNLSDQELNLLKGDSFDIEYFVTYNNKDLDAKVEVDIVGDDVIKIDGNTVIANEIGETQIVFSANWNGLSTRRVYNVNVVNNLTAKLYHEPALSMCNDKEGGLFEVLLAPELYENDALLNAGEYTIVSANFDSSIIDFNKEDLIITALAKGTTELTVTFKSLNTQNTINTVLPISVDLFNQDKFDKIRIPDAYISENSYKIELTEVFSDISPSNLNGLNIVNIVDMTDSMPIKLKLENGIVDLSNFNDSGILGQRRWRVETEKYSYDVKIVVEKFNYVTPLIGKYNASNWDFGLEIKFENRQKTFNITDALTKQVKHTGMFELSVWDETSGGITLLLNTPFSGQKEISGYYWMSSGKMFMDLNIYQIGGYVELYSLTGAPYQEISGVYGDNITWAVDIQLNNDKTCVFDCNNDISKKCNGKYELVPIDAYNGKIIVEIEKPFNGQTIFEGSYKLVNGVYRLDIYIEVLSRVQKLYQTNAETAIYDSFAGYYSASGKDDKGETVSWLPMKLTKDGALVFDYKKWGGNVNTTGRYKLIGDVNSGTIIIDINKAYSGNKKFTGEYELIDGKYVFKLVIPGSGVDVVTYKQGK